MFGNKGYGWKLAAGLVLIAALGVDAGLRGSWINPSVWSCLAEPTRADGLSIWVPTARVIAVRDHEYEIESGTMRIRVQGPAPAPAASRISLVAIFHAEGPRLEPLRTRVLAPGDRIRRAMELISVIVTLGVLANFARYFLFRPKVLQVEREPR